MQKNLRFSESIGKNEGPPHLYSRLGEHTLLHGAVLLRRKDENGGFSAFSGSFLAANSQRASGFHLSALPLGAVLLRREYECGRFSFSRQAC